jgi:uncharacterized protein DUF5677
MRTRTNIDLKKIKDLDNMTPAERLAFLYGQAQCIASDDPGFGEIGHSGSQTKILPQAILKSKSPTARPARSGAEFNMEPDDRIFEIGLAAADKIRARLEKAEITGSDVEKFLPLVYFFVRAYKSYAALHLLWTSGYIEDAYTLARTIYELRLQAGFMAEDLDNRSIQFAENVFATALEYYRRLDPAHAEQGKAMAEEMAQIRKEFRISKGLPEEPPKYQPNWWGGGGIKRLVEALKLPVNYEYETIYFRLSDHAHSSTSLVHRYATRNENSLRLAFSHERSHKLLVPHSASLWLLQIGQHVSKAIGFGLEEELEQAAVELNRFMKSKTEVTDIKAKL